MVFCAYWQAADGTRRSLGTCATPALARPLIQIQQEDEGHTNRMRTDRIDGENLCAVPLALDSHWTEEAPDTFRKVRHQDKRKLQRYSRRYLLSHISKLCSFFLSPFGVPLPPTSPLISLFFWKLWGLRVRRRWGHLSISICPQWDYIPLHRGGWPFQVLK